MRVFKQIIYDFSKQRTTLTWREVLTTQQNSTNLQGSGSHSGADEDKTPCRFGYKLINMYHAK
jgi:hypothetical protein